MTMEGEVSERRGGYATLYLTLALGVFIAFFVFLLYMARQQTMKLETECVTQTAIESVFAEYNKPLLEKYDLFFVDTAYGTGNPSIQNTAGHLVEYMNHNFERLLPGISLTALRAEGAAIQEYSLATDKNGAELKRQAVEQEKFQTGIGLVEDIGDWAAKLISKKAEGEEAREWKQSVDEQVDGIRHQRREKEDGEYEEQVLQTPADGIGLDGVIVRAALGGGALSGLQYPVDKLASHRSRQTGNVSFSGATGLEGVLDQGIFTAYLLQHCSRYGKSKEDTSYQYQLEYILKGKPVESDNLEAVCQDIFLIRYGINMAYLLQDAEKKSEAQAIATAASLLIWLPESADLIKTFILLAWGYAESIQDLRILLDGEGVPFVKSADSWQISLTELPFFKSRLGSYEAKGGNKYQDYLAAFLFLQNRDEQNLRLADVIEADIRQSPGYEAFRLDGCLGSMNVEVLVSSRYGGEFTLDKSYSYLQ